MNYAKAMIAALVGTAILAPVGARPAGYCPAIVKYVCALKDGARKTYVNSCFARADAGKKIRLGKCEGEATSQMKFCPEQLILVCATKNGTPTTYGNACIAIADGVTILHKGSC